MSAVRPRARARRAFLAALVLLVPCRALADGPGAGVCAPPRTVVLLLPLADQTDHTWQLWSGESPARLVGRLLADSLERSSGRRVLEASPAPAPGARAGEQPVDDERALAAARARRAEIAVTGTVTVFAHDDRREPGRLARWGVGAADARSRVQVSVTLRALDAADGTVLIESTASRERTGRGTASAARPEPGAAPARDALVDQVLGDVLADLTRTLGARLDERWRARVLAQRRDVFVLDAGLSRGLFPGERLDVWRPGIEQLDENLVQVGDEARVGVLVVLGFEGRGHERARARLAEGEARAGDLVRPCSVDEPPSLSLSR